MISLGERGYGKLREPASFIKASLKLHLKKLQGGDTTGLSRWSIVPPTSKVLVLVAEHGVKRANGGNRSAQRLTVVAPAVMVGCRGV